MTKEGLKTPNYFGSLTQAATLRIGNYKGEELFTPFKSLLPMVKPEDIVFGGWDISSANLADAMERAQVNLSCPYWLANVILQFHFKLHSVHCKCQALLCTMLYLLAAGRWTPVLCFHS